MTNIRTVMGSVDQDQHPIVDGGGRCHHALGRKGDPHRGQRHLPALGLGSSGRHGAPDGGRTRQAAFREAEARECLAEAKAVTVASAVIAEGDVNAINCFVAQKYTEALQQIGSVENQKVVMLPLEAPA